MTSPALSLIVPVLNEQAVVATALGNLQHWRAAGIAELIVVDGGSDDATVAMARPWCDQLLQVAAGRALQMNAGAGAARGRVLMFLHCDTQLALSPLEMIAEIRQGAHWGFFRVQLSGRHWGLRCIEWAMNVRSRWTRIATGDQLIWAERELFERLSGYADIPLMEDVELCKRLREVSAPQVLSPPVVTSSRRWEENGRVKTVLLMWWLRLCYWWGVSPQVLADKYYG